MRSRISSSSRLPDFVVLILVVGLLGITPSTMRAQTTECVDEPLLEFFDANGDGVLREEEIRAADPDNAELQSMADRMDDEGVAGLQYTGCDESDDGDQAPDTAGDVVQDVSTQAVVATPDVDDTRFEDNDGQFSSVMVMVGAAGVLVLVGAFALRSRSSA